jgi:hypothetical protein
MHKHLIIKIIIFFVFQSIISKDCFSQSTSFDRLKDFFQVSIEKKIEKLNQLIGPTKRITYFSNGSYKEWTEYWSANEEGLIVSSSNQRGYSIIKWNDIEMLRPTSQNRVYLGRNVNSIDNKYWWPFITPANGKLTGCEDIATLIRWIMSDMELGKPNWVGSIMEDQDDIGKPQYIKDAERAAAREAQKQQRIANANANIKKYSGKALAGDNEALRIVIDAYNVIGNESEKITFLQKVFNNTKNQLAKESLINHYENKMSSMKYEYKESRKGWWQIAGGLAIITGTWIGANALVDSDALDPTTGALVAVAGIVGGGYTSIMGIAKLSDAPNYKYSKNYLQYQRKIQILKNNGTLTFQPIWNISPINSGPGLIVAVRF